MSQKRSCSYIRQDDPLVKKLQAIGLNPKERPKHKDLPRASILVPFFWSTSRKEWHILLTQRPLHMKSHAGEVCFPGGKQEEQDQGDDCVTAMRETHEEVGIPRDWITPVSRMEPIESVGGLCVTPIVAILSQEIMDPMVDLTICKTEVEAAFSVPISYFWDDDNCDSQQELEWRGDVFVMRYYYYKDPVAVVKEEKQQTHKTFKIWGLTAHVAYQVAQLCMPDDYDDPKASPPSLQGSLLRWMDEGSGKPYWAQRYYVLQYPPANKANSNNNNASVVLHQYENERKATLKADTATKKNRLLIATNSEDSSIIVEAAHSDGKVERYGFTISVMDGRMDWKLAATSKEDQEKWVSTLSSLVGDSGTAAAATNNDGSIDNNNTDINRRKKPKASEG